MIIINEASDNFKGLKKVSSTHNLVDDFAMQDTSEYPLLASEGKCSGEPVFVVCGQSDDDDDDFILYVEAESFDFAGIAVYDSYKDAVNAYDKFVKAYNSDKVDTEDDFRALCKKHKIYDER